MKSQDIVITEDKEKIGFDHFKSGGEKVIIIAPGFFNSKEFKLFQKIALDFTTFYDVIMFLGNARESVAAPSGTEHIFNAGTRISCSAKSVTGGDNVDIWVEIQEI